MRERLNEGPIDTSGEVGRVTDIACFSWNARLVPLAKPGCVLPSYLLGYMEGALPSSYCPST